MSCIQLLLLCSSLEQVCAQSPSKEYQLKAVLLWRLAQYTEWPADAFKTADAPIVIGVIGENRFGDALQLAVRDEKAHGRPLEVRYYKSDEQPDDCHLLFISDSEQYRLRSLLARLRDKNILTVSDIETFARNDNGMIRFAMEQNRVNLIVNLEAVTAARLVLDARLLRMAEIVKPR
jgi:hypothetical protein